MLANAQVFRKGLQEKLTENGPKTGNSFVMHNKKWAIIDHNVGQIPLLSILRHATRVQSIIILA